ncbi:clotting factor B-like isoform X2 [Ornithodoros turicata]|uniref:clotting factor B-like isoform X2 n=1 Tax=Ornithodoros turicata TaxID=34597 RepID=UPI00313A36C6
MVFSGTGFWYKCQGSTGMKAIRSLLSFLLLASAVLSQDAPCGKKRSKNQPGVEWPWLGSIVELEGEKPEYVCMGMLISRKHVVTAAHCFDAKSLDTRKYNVFLETDSSDAGTAYNIQLIDLHPSYIPGSSYADLAILTLEADVADATIPICLPDPTEVYDYKPSFVAEWLPKSPGAGPPYQLKAQRALISTNEVCKMQYSSLVLDTLDQGITDNELCTDLRARQGDCTRLNASPLMIPDRSVRWKLASIAAYRHSCDDQSYPGVYTRITQYLPWIESMISSTR